MVDGRLGGMRLKGELSLEDVMVKKLSPAELARLKVINDKTPADGWNRPKIDFTRGRRNEKPFKPGHVGNINGYHGVDLDSNTTMLFRHLNRGMSFVLDIYGVWDGNTLLAISKRRGFNLDDYERRILKQR